MSSLLRAFVDAENASGTADNVNSSIPFLLKGLMKQDKDGLPEIIAF